MIRVLLADDNAVIRGGLVALLATLDDVEVVGQASTGADGEQPLTGNVEVGGDALAFRPHNLNLVQKTALCSVSQESLFVRDTGAWIKTSAALFDNQLSNPLGARMVKYVTVTSSDGTTSQAYQGYATPGAVGGGDWGLVGNAGLFAGFDEHNSSYPMLNRGCWNHYIYSKSSAVLDGDAGYSANIGLGDWTATKWVSSAFTHATGKPWLGFDFGPNNTLRINSLVIGQTSGNAVGRLSLEWSDDGSYYTPCSEFVLTDAEKYSGKTPGSFAGQLADELKKISVEIKDKRGTTQSNDEGLF